MRAKKRRRGNGMDLPPPDNRPPEGPFIWETLEMVESAAFRTVIGSPNAARFLFFLAREWMRTGGRRNGLLLAPHHQLYATGIGEHHVSAAIHLVEKTGLVKVHRGGHGRATTYALTWLPLYDGTPASNRWRDYLNPKLKPLPVPKSRKLPANQQVPTTCQSAGTFSKTACQSAGTLPKTACQSAGTLAQNTPKTACQSAGPLKKILTRGKVMTDSGLSEREETPSVMTPDPPIVRR
jgi:hypothetical protein